VLVVGGWGCGFVSLWRRGGVVTRDEDYEMSGRDRLTYAGVVLWRTYVAVIVAAQRSLLW
jgi:hypothetical protein